MKRVPLRLAVLIGAVAVALAAAVYAFADQTGSVSTCTGCLNTSAGTVSNLAAGDEPLSRAGRTSRRFAWEAATSPA